MRTNIKVKLELFYKNRAHLCVKQRKAHCCYQKEQHTVGKRKKNKTESLYSQWNMDTSTWFYSDALFTSFLFHVIKKQFLPPKLIFTSDTLHK